MKRFDDSVLVTRPVLPDLAEFQRGCEEIWRNRWLTNDGPMLERFHAELADYLKVPEDNLAIFCNGTLALEMGFKAMGLEGGEVITTPFTFVATSHAIRRIGATPVFADIDPETMCLSPAAAEKLIRPGTTRAIVPVHVYGNRCDVEGFAALGRKYGLKIIYDAAHAFGTDYHRFGDMSMFSFHSTKLFHSCEGGLLVFGDAALQPQLFNLRNFAIQSETECTDVGTNAKMNELQALMGRLNLKRMDEILAWRRRVSEVYEAAFAGHAGLRFSALSGNHAYCPLLLPDFETRERIYGRLKTECNVFSRRYFYPLLTDFSPYRMSRGTCPVAEDVARRVLCLPTYHGLSPADAASIAENIIEML